MRIEFSNNIPIDAMDILAELATDQDEFFVSCLEGMNSRISYLHRVRE